MIGHTWNRESREFKIIVAIFDERFPREYLEAMTNLSIRDDIDFETAYEEAQEMHFQAFLAAWEFLRGITESNDSALEELSKLEPPEWSEG
jgi:hypothetical protein